MVIGSRKVTEGYNIMGVNNAFVLQTPYNIPKLLQVIGRVVRNRSHIHLPVEARYVNIHLLVNVMQSASQPTVADVVALLKESDHKKSGLYGKLSRDQLFYFKRFDEYATIQHFEQIIHQCARDVGMYGQLYFRKSKQPNGEVQYSLDNELRLTPFAIPEMPAFDEQTHSASNPYYLSFYRLRYQDRLVQIVERRIE